jgi:hypothetical protein
MKTALALFVIGVGHPCGAGKPAESYAPSFSLGRRRTTIEWPRPLLEPI